MSCLPPHKSCGDPATALGGRSSGTGSGKPSRKLSERQLARSLRTTFRDDWRAFLRSEFEDPIDVAHNFACDPDTANNWWEGFNSPQGAFVRLAFLKWPERAAVHLLKGIAS